MRREFTFYRVILTGADEKVRKMLEEMGFKATLTITYGFTIASSTP
mgnify:CR=1 FL=1